MHARSPVLLVLLMEVAGSFNIRFHHFLAGSFQRFDGSFYYFHGIFNHFHGSETEVSTKVVEASMEALEAEASMENSVEAASMKASMEFVEASARHLEYYHESNAPRSIGLLPWKLQSSLPLKISMFASMEIVSASIEAVEAPMIAAVEGSMGETHYFIRVGEY